MTATGAIPRATHEGVLDLGPIKIACAVLADGTRVVSERHGWPYKAGQRHHPGVVGHIINEIVYRRLPPGVLDMLRVKNPSTDGRRATKHHQHLTIDIGIEHLDRQIRHCISLMRASRTWRMFMDLLRQSQPLHGDQLALAEVTMSTQAPSSSRSAS